MTNDGNRHLGAWRCADVPGKDRTPFMIEAVRMTTGTTAHTQVQHLWRRRRYIVGCEGDEKTILGDGLWITDYEIVERFGGLRSRGISIGIDSTAIFGGFLHLALPQRIVRWGASEHRHPDEPCSEIGGGTCRRERLSGLRGQASGVAEECHSRVVQTSLHCFLLHCITRIRSLQTLNGT